jgi:hypothetical protein
LKVAGSLRREAVNVPPRTGPDRVGVEGGDDRPHAAAYASTTTMRARIGLATLDPTGQQLGRFENPCFIEKFAG